MPQREGWGTQRLPLPLCVACTSRDCTVGSGVVLLLRLRLLHVRVAVVVGWWWWWWCLQLGLWGVGRWRMDVAQWTVSKSSKQARVCTRRRYFFRSSATATAAGVGDSTSHCYCRRLRGGSRCMGCCCLRRQASGELEGVEERYSRYRPPGSCLEASQPTRERAQYRQGFTAGTTTTAAPCPSASRCRGRRCGGAEEGRRRQLSSGLLQLLGVVVVQLPLLLLLLQPGWCSSGSRRRWW